MANDIELPMDMGEWDECRIIEDIGTEEEHDDQFYRYGDYGIEACRHGIGGSSPTYETYVILDETPYKVGDCYGSFEEAVGALVHASGAKALDAGDWSEDDDESDDDGVDVVEIEVDDIAKSSITDMISRNREDRKAPAKVEIERDMPPLVNGQMRTPRSVLRTVHIGDGKDAAMPKDIKVHDEEPEGATRRRA